MPTDNTNENRGIRSVLNGLIALCLNRTELFSVELQELKIELLRCVFLLVFSLLVLFFALFSALALIVFATPAEWRVLMLAVITFIFTASGCFALLYLKHRLDKQDTPFSTTLNEIRKDWATLNNKR